MIREQICKLLNAKVDRETMAKYVCCFLENEFELHGNGWFDDDPVMDSLFSKTNDPIAEAAAKELFRAVEIILEEM